MRKLIIAAFALAGLIAPISAASAHQPVVLLATDTSAQKGPLLKDGTISFAIRASFQRAGEVRGFRAALKSGDSLAVQYLIVNKKPENALKSSQLPRLVITSPQGKRTTLSFTERTPFYEPYGKTNYLYLSRYTTSAEEGIYSFTLTSRAKAAVTIAVGEKEIPGDVIRGALSSPAAASSPTASPTPMTSASAQPTPTPTPAPSSATPKPVGITLEQVRQNNSSSKCWTVINGMVYDLTSWISAHPGGSSPIRSLCGTDGTSAFTGMHGNQTRPERTLDSYKLGPLAK